MTVQVIATLLVLASGAAGARWAVRAARRRPQLRAGGVMVLRRPRKVGVLVAACGSFFGMLFGLGLAGVLPDSDAPIDWSFVGVMGAFFLITIWGAAALIGDTIVVRLVDGQIAHRPVFGGERQFHVSSVARVVPVPGGGWLAHGTGIVLLDAEGRSLLTITGVWRGTDHLVEWLRTNRPQVLIA